jgi:hypothetical protein
MYPLYSVLNLKEVFSSSRIILPVQIEGMFKALTGQEYEKLVWFSQSKLFTYQHFRRTILLHYKNVV